MVPAADDLRQRLARARAQTQAVVRPQPAPLQGPAPRISLDRAQPSVVGRLYGVPVIGHAVRIGSALFNMPKILANLSAHYRSHNREVGELRALIAELRLELDHSQVRLNKAQARLSALETQAQDVDASGARRDA